MGVTLSPSSIPKLRQAIADGEAFRLGRGADRLPPGPDSGSFWAFITGCAFEQPDYKNASASDVRMAYSFLRVVPARDAEADVWLNKTQGYRFADTLAHIHAAVEVNGRPTPTNEIVRMVWTGYEEADAEVDGRAVRIRRPRFAFSYAPTRVEYVLPNHDHRDNFNGGFAFAVYAPGTSLPQKPWAL